MKSDRCVIGRRSVDLSTGAIDGHGTLRPRELALLRYLLAHRDRVVSGEELLEEVWGYRRGVRTKTLYSTIHRLREQLEEDPSRPAFVLAERGEGYRIALDAAPPDEPTLPAPVDRFIGREEAIARTLAALDRTRLVSLVGGPGFGKTRLAQQIALTHAEQSRWLAITTETLPWPSLARLLGVAVAPAETDLPLVVCRALRALGPCWLVLDDADRIDPAERSNLWALLQEVPALRVLATVREPLAIPGEQLVEVAPLTLEESVRFICGRLPSLAESDAALIRLAEQMQGIPLALDLASALIPTLGLPGLLEALEQSIETLELAASPQRPGLLAAITRSWEALSETDRRLLLGLTNFRGSFTLENAGEIFGPASIGSIARLTRRSLLHARPSDGAARYRMLDPINEALRRMAPEDILAEIDLLYARRLQEKAESANDIEKIGRLVSQIADLRHAISLFIGRGQSQDAIELTLTLANRLPVGGCPDEILLELRRCAAIAREPESRARIANTLSRVLRLSGRPQKARVHAEEALEISSDPLNRAAACIHLVLASAWLDDGPAASAAAETFYSLAPLLPAGVAIKARIDIARAWLSIDPSRVSKLLDDIDRDDATLTENDRLYLDTLRAATLLGTDPLAAEIGLREILRQHRAAGRRYNADQTSCVLAHHLLRQGRAAEADHEMASRHDPKQNLVLDNVFRAWSAWLGGEVERCRRCLEEALEIAVQYGDPIGEALACTALAQIERGEGNTRETLQLLLRASKRNPSAHHERWEIVTRIEAGEALASPEGSDLASRCAAALLAARQGSTQEPLVIPAVHELSDRIGFDLTQRSLAAMGR